jgi:transcriptional regulator with XRE-family HTH domain
VKIKIDINTTITHEYETTGYKLYTRRKELNLTSRQLSNITGIPRSSITSSERTNRYLPYGRFVVICKALNLDPIIVMDNEYKFFYEGYGYPINQLINEVGMVQIEAELGVKRRAILSWKYRKTLPLFQYRRKLIHMYNKYCNKE